MFGVSDRDDVDLETLAEPRRSWLQRLFNNDSEDLGWPYSSDPDVIFFLNERVSPTPLRARDLHFIVALAATLAFHLLLVLALRSDSAKAALAALVVPAARPRIDEKVTPFYFVEMPNQKEEKPSREQAPLSDMDRRAHGGEGAPSDRPGSQGNTEELRLAPPGGFAPGPGQADQRSSEGQNQRGESDRGAGKGEQNAEERAGNERNLADSDPSAVLIVPKSDQAGERQQGRLRGMAGLGGLGAEGGLVPNRRGGSVDLGPLSFDTQWYNWGPYAAEMLRRIRYHWAIPEIARMGVPGVVRIRFFIERSGRVVDLAIEKVSDHPSMDFAARDAILNASPLPPLPADLTGVDREGVTIAFYYNTRIPEHDE
jgi:TonB family protein